MKLVERLNNQEVAGIYRNRKVIPPFKIGKYKLSIQASEGHYCSPRKNLPDYSMYNSFEMLIIKENGDDIQFKKSSIIRNYPKYYKLLSHYDGEGIFGWVDKDILEDFVNYLESVK
jgi:hypothetical protein|tara:strand:- start:585 stop:932 length:348 start_codon:yes stop_codon:yes gene_type:complete